MLAKCLTRPDTNLRETEVLLLVGLGETGSELFCWLASKMYNSRLQLEEAGERKSCKQARVALGVSAVPLQAWSCWVRTLRISFTHAVLISGVGACTRHIKTVTKN